LGELEQQVNALQGQQQQYLANLEQQLQSQVAARLTTELEAYAAETGIDVIVNWGLSGEGVLYGAEPFNITQPLLAFLNERVERPQLDAEEVPDMENEGE
jgi:Skp family chaperone for outer membrane proteins